MIARAFKNFVRDENGMEMVEWALVGVVFALAAAALWTTLTDDIGTALGKVGDCGADGPGRPPRAPAPPGGRGGCLRAGGRRPSSSSPSRATCDGCASRTGSPSPPS